MQPESYFLFDTTDSLLGDVSSVSLLITCKAFHRSELIINSAHIVQR